MKATKIKMKSGCYYSTRTSEISEIYIEGCTSPGFFDKTTLHNYLEQYPHSIQVKLYPFISPYIIVHFGSDYENVMKFDVK